MKVTVGIPTHLHRYTDGVAQVDFEAADLPEVLRELDRRFPGIAFRIVDEQDRIRSHIRLTVGEEIVTDLAHPLAEGAEVRIIAALSGG